MKDKGTTQYFVYMIECQNGAYYVGYTTDVDRRYREHIAGSAKCKYTRSFPPRRLAAYWLVGNELSMALKLERQLKKLSAKAKAALAKQTQPLAEMLTSLNL